MSNLNNGTNNNIGVINCLANKLLNDGNTEEGIILEFSKMSDEDFVLLVMLLLQLHKKLQTILLLSADEGKRRGEIKK